MALVNADKIDWSTTTRSPLYGVIIGTNLRMKARQEAIRRSGRLIEFLIAGDHMAPGEIRQLEEDLRDETGEEDYTLPSVDGLRG